MLEVTHRRREKICTRANVTYTITGPERAHTKSYPWPVRDPFPSAPVQGWGREGNTSPSLFSPYIIEIARQDRDERVFLDVRKSMIHDFKVFDHWYGDVIAQLSDRKWQGDFCR